MQADDPNFQGDKKVGGSLLSPYQESFKAYMLPRIPDSVKSYHLTLVTLPMAALAVLSGYLAQFNIEWLGLLSLAIIIQELTDMLDGALGRYRDAGLAKWGYYMDHFFDYIFLCSVLIGYSFLIPTDQYYILFFTLCITGGYMVSSFLEFGASNRMQIFHMGIGPSEVKLLFIVINSMMTVLGKIYFVKALPYIFVFTFIGLCIVGYQTQARLWKQDLNREQVIFRPGRRTILLLLAGIIISVLLAFYYGLQI